MILGWRPGRFSGRLSPGQSGTRQSSWGWVVVQIMRAFRFALAPTDTQLTAFAQHAGAQRWAFNYALGLKVTAHQQWRHAVAELVAQGVDEAVARKQVKTPIPNLVSVGAKWRSERGDAAADTEGVSPWWREVSSYAFSTGFRNADTAWRNFLDSRDRKSVV